MVATTGFSGSEVTQKGVPRGWNPDVDDQQARRDQQIADLLDAYAHHAWAWDVRNTLGLQYGYIGGWVKIGSEWTEIGSGRISLSNNALNYVQRTPAGVVSANTNGFSSDQIPMAQVRTESGIIKIAGYQDCRPELGIGADTTEPGDVVISFQDLDGQILATQVPLEVVKQWESYLTISVDQISDFPTDLPIGSGTVDFMVKWTGSQNLGDSVFQQVGNQLLAPITNEPQFSFAGFETHGLGWVGSEDTFGLYADGVARVVQRTGSLGPFTSGGQDLGSPDKRWGTLYVNAIDSVVPPGNGGGGPLTFPILAPNGTEANPSYAFTTPTSKGMFAFSPDTLDFSVGGLRRLTLSDGLARSFDPLSFGATGDVQIREFPPNKGGISLFNPLGFTRLVLQPGVDEAGGSIRIQTEVDPNNTNLIRFEYTPGVPEVRFRAAAVGTPIGTISQYRFLDLPVYFSIGTVHVNAAKASWEDSGKIVRNVLQLFSDDNVYFDSPDETILRSTNGTAEVVRFRTSDALYSVPILHKNGGKIQWVDSLATTHDFVTFFTDDQIYLDQGHPASKMNFRANPGAGLQLFLQLDAATEEVLTGKSFVPAAGGAGLLDLGASANRFRNLYLSGNIVMGGSLDLVSDGFINITVNQTDSGQASMGITSNSAEAFISSAGNAAFAGQGVIKFLNEGVERARITTAGQFLLNAGVDSVVQVNTSDATGSPFVSWHQNTTRRMFIQYADGIGGIINVEDEESLRFYTIGTWRYTMDDVAILPSTTHQYALGTDGLRFAEVWTGRVYADTPLAIWFDNDAATDAAYLQYMQFSRANRTVDMGFIGFGSSTSTDLSVVNRKGDVTLWSANVLRFRLSATTEIGANLVRLNGGTDEVLRINGVGSGADNPYISWHTDNDRQAYIQYAGSNVFRIAVDDSGAIQFYNTANGRSLSWSAALGIGPSNGGEQDVGRSSSRFRTGYFDNLVVTNAPWPVTGTAIYAPSISGNTSVSLAVPVPGVQAGATAVATVFKSGIAGMVATITAVTAGTVTVQIYNPTIVAAGNVAVNVLAVNP